MAAKRRTAAQKAATKKLVALNRRRKNPPRARRATPAAPAKRRAPARRRAAPVRGIRRRRNPIRSGPINAGMDMVQGAIPAALGAVALDALWANLPLPASIKTGMVGQAAKGVGAVAMALAARRVVSKKTADAMGVGALTVMMHGAIKQLAAQTVPGLNLGCDTGYSGMGYYPPASSANLGYYPPESSANLGYINAATPAEPAEEMSFIR